MLMTFTGRASRQGLLPVGMDEALAYFSDVRAFIQKIEDVKDIKDLALPRAYLMTHHPIGALNFHVTFVTALQAEGTDTGLRLKSLDFDHQKIKSEHHVLKGFIDGELVAQARGQAETAVDFNFELSIGFEVPGALALIPKSLIQTTADGLMKLKLALVIENLYGKVRQDFNLPT